MKAKLTLLGLIGLAFTTCFGSPKSNKNDMKPKTSFYKLSFLSIDGKKTDFADFKGKYVLIVNTASKCGYTPQYKELQELSEKYGDKLVVLGFPSDDFGGQEYDTNEEVVSFCQKNYGVTFPLFERSDVKGDSKNVVFQWLTDPEKNGWNKDEPTWNFCKYFIDTEGTLVKFFPSKIKPLSEEITGLIK